MVSRRKILPWSSGIFAVRSSTEVSRAFYLVADIRLHIVCGIRVGDSASINGGLCWQLMCREQRVRVESVFHEVGKAVVVWIRFLAMHRSGDRLVLELLGDPFTEALSECLGGFFARGEDGKQYRERDGETFHVIGG